MNVPLNSLTIPIFPLPNVVLFPKVFLPLHIFESRYREMVKDAMQKNKVIGIVLHHGSSKSKRSSSHQNFLRGCSGIITHCEKMEDGRFNILLKGNQEFQIIEEIDSKTYRQAKVEVLNAIPPTEALKEERIKLDSQLRTYLLSRNKKWSFPVKTDDLTFINNLCHHFEFDTLEKQTLLEQETIVKRCQLLRLLLEMKVLFKDSGTQSGYVQ